MAIVRATWIAASTTLAHGSRVTVVLSWLARGLALAHLVTQAVEFVQRVMQPDVRYALLSEFGSLTYSGLWVVCALAVASVYFSRGKPVHASSSLLLVVYSITSIVWLRPVLASSMDGLGGPFALHLQIAVPMLASIALDSLFAVALAWLAYRTIPLVGGVGGDETTVAG